MSETGDWIEWKGGPCPVQATDRFYIKYRDDLTSSFPRGGPHWVYDPVWQHNGEDTDIVAYRIVKP